MSHRHPSAQTVTGAEWQRMARECGVGWPMLRERIVDLCDRAVDGLRDLPAASLCATGERVAGIIRDRAGALPSCLG